MNITEFKGTVSLDQKDRELLEVLLAHLERLGSIPAPEAEKAEPVKQDEPAPVTIEPEELKADPEALPVCTVTREKLQTLVVQLCGTDKKAQAAAIVKSYAPKVSAIPEDKIGAVYAELLGLVSEDED